jgi:hypothetical protein
MMSKWYEYLTAVYPPRGDDTARKSAYLLAFADEEPAVVLEAAKALSRELKWMPAVSELGAMVRRLKAEAEAAADQTAVDWAHREIRRRQWQAEYESWPVCVDGCGERLPPGVTVCPFCEDLAGMMLVETGVGAPERAVGAPTH